VFLILLVSRLQRVCFRLLAIDWLPPDIVLVLLRRYLPADLDAIAVADREQKLKAELERRRRLKAEYEAQARTAMRL
jgi:hypothetical protein